MARACRDRAEDPALHGRDLGRCSTASAAPASASCSRARRARCSTSTTAPIRSSPRPTRSRRRRRSAPASARARSATCSASPRPTPRASAPARSRPSCTDEIGERIGERGREFGTVTGRKRRCGWFDAALVRQTIKVCGIDGIALTKLDVLDGFEELKVGVGYKLDGERIDRLPAGSNAQARVEPVYETLEGWSQSTRGRAQLGRAAGAGGQVRALHRGADRVPGDAALDQPRARRHDPDARSVRRLGAEGAGRMSGEF